MTDHDARHRKLLSRWLAGDASAAEERELDAAAAADPTLAAELTAHRRVLAAVRSLPAARAPERDLWPEIAARLAPPRRSRWPLALAAGLALVAVGLALAGRRLAAPDPRFAAVEAWRPAAAPAGARLAAYAETADELSAIGAELRRAIEARRDALPPETRRLVFDNLATIERALADIEAALAERPADAALARTYIAYREREIALLRQANRLAARL